MRAIDFVAIDPGIASDEKIVAIAEALRKDRYAIAGRFPVFFGNVARHSPDGNLSRFSDATLDSWADGLRGFGALVRAGMCDSAGVLMSWHRYNGAKLAKLQDARDRAAEWRKEQKAKRDNMRTERESTANSMHTVLEPSVYETHLTDTHTDTDTHTEDLQLHPAAAARGREARLRDLLPANCHEALRLVLLRAGVAAEGVALDILERIGDNPKQIGRGPGMRFTAPAIMAEVIERAKTKNGPDIWHAGWVNSVIAAVERDGVAGEKRPERASQSAPAPKPFQPIPEVA